MSLSWGLERWRTCAKKHAVGTKDPSAQLLRQHNRPPAQHLRQRGHNHNIHENKKISCKTKSLVLYLVYNRL